MTRKLEQWWDSLPEWSRWILFFPAVLLCQIATMLLITWPSFFMHFEKLDFVWFKAAQTAIATYTIIYLGFSLAPRHKIKIGWFFYVIMGVFSGLGIAAGIFKITEHSLSWNDGAELAGNLMWFVVGIPVMQKFTKDYRTIDAA